MENKKYRLNEIIERELIEHIKNLYEEGTVKPQIVLDSNLKCISIYLNSENDSSVYTSDIKSLSDLIEARTRYKISDTLIAPRVTNQISLILDKDAEPKTELLLKLFYKKEDNKNDR